MVRIVCCTRFARVLKHIKWNISTLTTSDHKDSELHNILIHVGVRSADYVHLMKWGEEVNFWEAFTVNEDVAVSVAPAPVSLAASFGPTFFAVW